ncbi:helix-turn-helix transcriptional regulator [Leucobacter sp. wl10]|uniref:helix-turn-helix transcriptional regulator n=1 Tax=Leucobacter sp. wl10 TaxID=2304677 RepID=UPI0013C2D7F3|nr:helix-turn-helix transcriptional regulator [Leucobacter sp. wl10]
MLVGSRGDIEGSRDVLERRVRPSTTIPHRLERVIDAAEPSASVTLLIGEPGNGKASLAQQAAEELRSRATGVETLVLPHPPRASSGIASVFSADFGTFGEEQDPAELSRRVLEQVERWIGGTDLVLVALDIDDYSPLDSQILAHLARARRVRIIATARYLTSDVERICHGPSGRLISIGPLDLAESGTYLADLLRVERIEAETLRGWHEASGGNSHALTTLALASDRTGALRRARGTAWVPSDADQVPHEFADLVTETCTAEERDALELIAQAEPVMESTLLRSIDAACLSRLFERGMVASKTHDGRPSLVVTHPLLAASLRSGMSPVRMIQLSDQIFRALDEDRGGCDPTHAPDRLMRLVVFGLEGGRELPLEWLWTALELTDRGGDPRLVLRLAMATAVHPGAEAGQAAVAVLRASRIANLLGDGGMMRSALRIIRGLLDDPARSDALEQRIRVALHTTLIRQTMWEGGDISLALAALDELDGEVEAADPMTTEVVRSTRVFVLACSGRIRAAAEAGPRPELSPDLGVEWARSPARAMQGLILEQQGALMQAVSSAENARRLSRLGPRSRADHVDLQGFCWLLGYWVSGSGESARQVLDELVTEAYADTHAEARYSGFVETGGVLLGVQEGRWSDVVESAERLVDRFERHDRYGLAALVQAALALALAVTGEREAAIRAIHASEVPLPGISLALGGHRRILVLRARQWLRGGDVLAEAERVAEWARAEGLALIELQALHAIAFETRAPSDELLERARALAADIDPAVGDAFVAHMTRIAAQPGLTAVDSEEPEVRLLADLGIWLPLPPVPGLTAREREVVLLAALGHTSRFIAERLYISARTVETHLSNVFAKLGIENRDELWRWAARNRAETMAMAPA